MIPVFKIDRLQAEYAPWSWPFVEQRSGDIDAYFGAQRRANPALWNGRLLLMRNLKVSDGVLQGAFFDADYASMLAGLEWGEIGGDASVVVCFPVAALVAGDGAFIVGKMAPHTRTGGFAVFPSGSVEPTDVVAGKVDLFIGTRRELTEETGISVDELSLQDGCFTLVEGPHVPVFKIMRAREPAEVLRNRILKNLAAQEWPEFTDIQIVRGEADIDLRMPLWMKAFLFEMWRQPHLLDVQ